MMQIIVMRKMLMMKESNSGGMGMGMLSQTMGRAVNKFTRIQRGTCNLSVIYSIHLVSLKLSPKPANECNCHRQELSRCRCAAKSLRQTRCRGTW
jgi:hypothetical protein